MFSLVLEMILLVCFISAVVSWWLVRSHKQAIQAEKSLMEQTQTAWQQELNACKEQWQQLQSQYTQMEQAHQQTQQDLQDKQIALSVAQEQLNHLQFWKNESEQSKTQIAQLQEQLTQAQSINAGLQTKIAEQRLAHEEKLALLNQAHQQAEQEQTEKVQFWQKETQQLQSSMQNLQQELATSRIENQGLRTKMAEQHTATEEKLALLTEARQSFGHQFQHLAQEILEEKSKKFSEHSRENLSTLLTPLNEKLQGFSQLVQNTYEKESKERNTLENELKRLQELNNRLHDDAQALSKALTGTQNKAQGNWGEMILESVLTHSGLQKNREYFVQSSETQTDADGTVRRLQPDILVNLPDGKQIVIDSKVSLTAYVRHTQSQTAAEAEQEANLHLQSIRNHVKSLAQKDYSQLNGVRTLDFVFMFIPVEPAYLLALQQDAGLFQECFEKRIMLVGPSTLLATLRTIANIWRTEHQNQNALEIAKKGGDLYDKFVNFVASLESIGKNIQQSQDAYDKAMSQLKNGRGNLINRSETLRQLGVKHQKQLSSDWVLAADKEEYLPLLDEKTS